MAAPVSYRYISASEFARRVGMAPARARQLFRDRAVPTAHATYGPKGQVRLVCAEWAIREFQRTWGSE